MFLIEDEPTLADPQKIAKAQVLAAVQPVQPVHAFRTPHDLGAFLDQVLVGLAGAGFPALLTRVVLIYRQPAAVAAVRRRMSPTGTLLALLAPDAWTTLARDPAGLRAWAASLSLKG